MTPGWERGHWWKVKSRCHAATATWGRDRFCWLTDQTVNWEKRNSTGRKRWGSLIKDCKLQLFRELSKDSFSLKHESWIREGKGTKSSNGGTSFMGFNLFYFFLTVFDFIKVAKLKGGWMVDWCLNNECSLMLRLLLSRAVTESTEKTGTRLLLDCTLGPVMSSCKYSFDWLIHDKSTPK